MKEKTLSDVLVTWEEIQLGRKVKMCKVPLLILEKAVEKLRINEANLILAIQRVLQVNPDQVQLFGKEIGEYLQINEIFGDFK